MREARGEEEEDPLTRSRVPNAERLTERLITTYSGIADITRSFVTSSYHRQPKLEASTTRATTRTERIENIRAAFWSIAWRMAIMNCGQKERNMRKAGQGAGGMKESEDMTSDSYHRPPKPPSQPASQPASEENDEHPGHASNFKRTFARL